MPQCPICNAAVWVGQQYCSTCTNPLPLVEEQDHFCPQCGARLATPQEICQKCKPSLTEIAGIPITAPAGTWRLPFRIPRFFLGSGLIIAGLLLYFYFHKSPGPPQLIMTPPPQAASEQTPAAPSPAVVEPAPVEPAPALEPAPAAETAPAAPTVVVVQELAVPAATAASVPPAAAAPSPSLPRYFVNIHGLYIREGPDMSASRIATLNFKDEVELLETSGGWGKIRDLRRNVVGWSYMRYLQPLTADGPQAVPRHQASIPQKPDLMSSQASQDL